MSASRKRFSHVLITRPREEARELSGMLATMGIASILQPAQAFSRREVSPEDERTMGQMQPGALMVFTSPRAVEFGLPQLSSQLLSQSRIAAIGPATSRALAAAGRSVHVASSSGYTSEALLDELACGAVQEFARQALILCAPGGREKLLSRLQESGWDARPLWVYDRRAEDIDPESIEAIAQADRLLAVWTSGEAMDSLSQRMPPSAWFQICRGEWLVISSRLQILARAFGPPSVHLASGPGNTDLASAIRSLAATQ